MKKENGTTLVEALLVITIIGSIVFLLANIPNALMLMTKSRHTSLAREIAVKQIEDKRVINYTNLVNDSSPIIDSRISLLPGGNGTMVVEDCKPAICMNGEHIKQLTVTINWTENNKVQNLVLTTMIGEGGINQ